MGDDINGTHRSTSKYINGDMASIDSMSVRFGKGKGKGKGTMN